MNKTNLEIMIEEQRQENLRLFQTIPLASHADPNNEAAKPILKKWREGSKRSKELLALVKNKDCARDSYTKEFTRSEFEHYKEKEGQAFGKHQAKLFLVDGERVLLCGTPLADDDCFSSIASFIVQEFNKWSLAKSVGKLNEEDVSLNSELRDALYDVILDNLEFTIEYVWEEY